MNDLPAFLIEPVRTPRDLSAVVALLRAYAASLEIDLAYQNFAAELQAMPGQYSPPEGALLLARGLDHAPIGCVALRPLALEGCCEIKRLYVVPEGRGCGLGRCLAAAAIAAAERIGYREIRLDTLPSMTGAQALYHTLGFVPIEPYYDTPISGTIFMGLTLPRERD